MFKITENLCLLFTYKKDIPHLVQISEISSIFQISAEVLKTFSILKEVAFLKNCWIDFHKFWLYSIAAADLPSAFFFHVFLTEKHV